MQMTAKRRAKIAAILASLFVNGIVIYLMLGQWLEQSAIAAYIHKLLHETPTMQAMHDPAYAQQAIPPQQQSPSSTMPDDDDWVTLIAAQGSQDGHTACVLWDDPHVADSSPEQNDDVESAQESDSFEDEASQDVTDSEDTSPEEPSADFQTAELEAQEPTCMVNDIQEETPSAQLPTKKKRSRKKNSSKKSSFTLNDLVNGFVNSAPTQASAYADGGSTTNMQGSHAGKASVKQIMTRHYLEKVFNALQNSFRVNKNRLRAMPPIYSSKQTSIGMALDKKGNIVHLELIDSSSDFELDQFLLFVFKDAQGTYPTIPDAMEVEYYPVMYNNVFGLLQGSFSMATVSRASHEPPPPMRRKNFP